MKEPIQVRFGLLFLPTLQYSSTPKGLAPVPAKPLNSDLALRTRFLVVNKVPKMSKIMEDTILPNLSFQVNE